jgi:hypothetical protein
MISNKCSSITAVVVVPLIMSMTALPTLVPYKVFAAEVVYVGIIDNYYCTAIILPLYIIEKSQI